MIIPYAVVAGRTELISQAVFENKFPRTWEYLLANRKVLEAREGRMKHSGWYGFVYPKNLDLMSATKILVPDIADRVAFSLDAAGEFTFASGYGITLKSSVRESPLYILALLNSRLIDWFWKRVSTHLRGGFYRFFSQFIEQFPVCLIDFNDASARAEHDILIGLVQSVMKARGDSIDAVAIEAEINARVYKLFKLTPEEIQLVEEPGTAPASPA